MLAGISLFSVFTGYLADRFVRPKDRDKIKQLTAELADVRRLLSEQAAAQAAVEAKLDALMEVVQGGEKTAPSAGPYTRASQ